MALNGIDKNKDEYEIYRNEIDMLLNDDTRTSSGLPNTNEGQAELNRSLLYRAAKATYNKILRI
jgi:hypothetical protein